MAGRWMTPSPDDSKAFAIVLHINNAKAEEADASKIPGQSLDGEMSADVALAKLQHEKTLSFIKAWEDREKAKVENKAEKRQCKVTSWENSKKASLEAQLRKIEEHLERKKAEYAEKMKNKEALIHKRAEEKRAIVDIKKGESLLRTQQMAAKYRAAGQLPKSAFTFF